MIQARFELNEYTARVLDVVKGKFGLKNRSEALNRLVKEVGYDYAEPPVNEMVLRELDETYSEHKKKYGDKAMSLEELDKLLEWD